MVESIITWDWKDHPPWDLVIAEFKRVENSGGGAKVIEIQTRSDEVAAMIAPKAFSEFRAQKYFDNIDEYYPDDEAL